MRAKKYTGVGAVVGVYEYPDENRKEYVSEAVLSDEDAIKTLRGLPVHLKHSDNKVGEIDFATYHDGKVIVDFTITDREAIEKIESGKLRELSFQHVSDSLPVDGKGYTHVQGLRDYKHLAVVDVARGGRECSILINEEVQ